MKVIAVYAAMYGKAFTNALAAIAKNPWTLLLPMGLAVAWTVLSMLLGSVLDPFTGGMLISLAYSAALSIYCFFLGGLVANQKVGLDQLRTSIGAYFWSWISIFFVLWVVGLVLGPVFKANPDLVLPYTLVQAIALNTVPDGQQASWSNPQNQTSGYTKPIETTKTASGQTCREFQTAVTAQNQTTAGTGTACRQPDGTWKIIR